MRASLLHYNHIDVTTYTRIHRQDNVTIKLVKLPIYFTTYTHNIQFFKVIDAGFSSSRPPFVRLHISASFHFLCWEFVYKVRQKVPPFVRSMVFRYFSHPATSAVFIRQRQQIVRCGFTWDGNGRTSSNLLETGLVETNVLVFSWGMEIKLGLLKM